MAENQANANESMFCQATGLSQSVADRASVSLADGWQNTVHNTYTGHKFRQTRQKNSVESA